MQELFEKIISYHDLINGDLVPDKINASMIAEYLTNEQILCQDMIIGKFKKNNNEFQLIEKMRVSSAHPLAESYFCRNEIPFPNNIREVLSSNILNQLGLKLDKIDNNIFYRKNENLKIIGVAFDAEWEEMPEDRLRYCYLNTLLLEMEVQHINAIRQFTIIHNDEKLKSGIAKLQRVLNSYLTELIEKHNLKSSDLEVKVKNKYSEKDCAVLIYKSIVVVLDFISTTFYEYIDPLQNIPYYSKLLNQNNFVTKAKNILSLINKLELDERLKTIIHNELRKVLNLEISKRITYQHFDYYKRYLKYFTRFLEKIKFKELEEEDLIHFLVSINYRKQSFFEYIIEGFIDTFSDFEDLEEKNLFLLTKKKEYQQLQLRAYEQFNDKEPLLAVKILKWIDIELDYNQIKIQAIKQEVLVQKLEKIKLVTSLSGKDLAALFRILKDKELIAPETTRGLAKWIQESFTNDSNHEYSQRSLSNSIYQQNPSSLKKIRDLGLYILDATKLI